MSFSFAFDIDEGVVNYDAVDETPVSRSLAGNNASIAYAEVPVDELLQSLPPALSYTPVSVAPNTTLFRRDLFDARFQILNQSEQNNVIVDKSSDLIKRVYEGGLKTWECSLDLVKVLKSMDFAVAGKSVLDIGCGTALPSCAVFLKLLQEIRDHPGDAPFPHTTLHLQDYNKQVLSLMTLPNLILTYALFHVKTEDCVMDKPGEIELSDEFMSSFLDTLHKNNVQLKFSEGDWSGMAQDSTLPTYDLVLTSETIYSTDSLPSLVQLLRKTYSKGTCALVACKKVYFGVGGGIIEFVKAVTSLAGQTTTVYQDDAGVGRVVLRLDWA